MTNELTLSISLHGQTTTIEVEKLKEANMEEIVSAVELLLLGAGFQAETISKYIKI